MQVARVFGALVWRFLEAYSWTGQGVQKRQKKACQLGEGLCNGTLLPGWVF